MDDNWDDDEEGDGLTAQERRDLDRRLQGQLNGGRLGRGGRRNAASCVKKCNSECSFFLLIYIFTDYPGLTYAVIVLM